MSEVLGWFMGSAVLCFFRNLEKPKKICRESWPGPPPSRESGNIGVFVFWVSLFFCLFDVFGLPRSKSLQILPCLLPGSGDPNDHAYGSAAYVVKSRPIAKNVKNCSPSNCRSVIF